MANLKAKRKAEVRKGGAKKKDAAARKSASVKAGAKVDLYAEFAAEYVAAPVPALVRVGRASYLAIEGRGEPGGPEFQECMGALFAMAYTIKMTIKAAGRDYRVCPPEGLWWGKKTGAGVCDQPKGDWCWKLMIRVPSFVKEKDRRAAASALVKKGKGPKVEAVRIEALAEGRCVQALHVGPYDRAPETIAKMTDVAREAGLEFDGVHHEIYLSDPRRVPAARLRTILRHPVRRGPVST